MPDVRIRYHRPPDRTETFVQRLVLRAPDVVVTFLDRTPRRPPVVVDGRIVLETGSPIVWFTFPGAWHDIGRFHRADGTFTGYYANILTPVRFLDGDAWETTDLFLDVWQTPGHAPALLDEAEFRAAVDNGWIDAGTAASALAEAERILQRARRNAWPPAPVEKWTLERVIRATSDPADPGRGEDSRQAEP
ncbi:MAG TPA: DUF402 domain-containing protein [Longimicrobiales bacterium]